MLRRCSGLCRPTNALSSARHIFSPRVSLLVTARRTAFVNPDKPVDADSDEEVDRVALNMSRLIRLLSVCWLGSKLYEILQGGDTWLVAPSLTLVRSKQPENRESGIWRLANWHSNVLEAVVDQGGIEALIEALPTAKAETRSTIIELLTNSVPKSAHAPCAPPRPIYSCVLPPAHPHENNSWYAQVTRARGSCSTMQ